jgi:hypothetical protein
MGCEFECANLCSTKVVGRERRKDHTVPPSLAKEVATRQSKAKSATEYKEYPGRSHYTLGQEGWEEVTDYALDWAMTHATRPAA